MPGGYQPYNRKTNYSVLVRCPHGFEWYVDLAYIKAPRRLVDDCSMAQLERELEAAAKKERRLVRELKRRQKKGLTE